MPAVQLISNSNRPPMLPAHWDGNVEYSRLWYYPGCLKYWLRVWKPTAVIGMHVGITVSTWLIYRAFWCNSVGGKLIKHGSKTHFGSPLYHDRKYKLLFWKHGLSGETYFISFWSWFTKARRKKPGGGRARGAQVVLVPLNVSGAAGDN